MRAAALLGSGSIMLVRRPNIGAVIAQRRFDNPTRGNILDVSDRAADILRAWRQIPEIRA